MILRAIFAILCFAVSGAIMSRGSGNIHLVPAVLGQSVRATTPSIVSVSFDKPFVEKWCPVSKSPMASCPFGGDRVRVTTVVESENDEPVLYSYKVTAGKILGQGSNVTWDLANAVPGSHSIIVTATTRTGRKSKVTRSIDLRECPVCDPSCECPSITLTASKATLSPGQKVRINADVRGRLARRAKFNWTVEGGRITGGSKKSSIQVVSLGSTFLTATVEITGTDPSCGCPTIETLKIPMAATPNK